MRTRVLLCFPVILLVAASARAQCRVEGVVHLADGKPLAAATVRLDGPDYKQPLQTTTDADGRYEFTGVKAGVWVRIIALQGTRPVALGYTLVTQRLETLDLEEQPTPLDASSAEHVTASDGPAGEVAGTVAAADGQPIPGARITVGETSLTATTDSAGRYAIPRLRPGIHVDLHASASGFRAASQAVAIAENNRAAADFVLSAGTETEGGGVPLSTLELSADSGHVGPRPDEVAGVPSLVRKDLFRALQFLPGVAAGVSDSAEFYARGGTPDQTLVAVDGFNLYQFGAGGAFSAYNMDTVERADFSAISADGNDGGRLASTLRLKGRTTSGRPWSGFADVSAL